MKISSFAEELYRTEVSFKPGLGVRLGVEMVHT